MVRRTERDVKSPAPSWLYDDLLAWLVPGGLLLTGLALRFPKGLEQLRASAPELTLPTWFAGAYVLGLSLSPLGRLIYGISQTIMWPLLKEAWTPAIAYLKKYLAETEDFEISDAASMSVSEFHDVDRRFREHVEAVDPGSRTVLHKMKVLCSLSCNATAGCLVFIAVDALAGNWRIWTRGQVLTASLFTGLVLVTAVYRERRRQRTQLSIWRRLQVTRHLGEGAD